MGRARRILCAITALFSCLTVLSPSAWAGSAIDYQCTETSGAYLCSDTARYLPDSVAMLAGDGHASNSTLTIKVTRPDGSVVTGDGSGAAWPTAYDTVVTDAEGHFEFLYLVNGPAGSYQVEVIEGAAVRSGGTFACFSGAKAFIEDDAAITSSTLSTVTLTWDDAAGDPTQARVANDLTPADGCTDLGGGSFGAWQPVDDLAGTNSAEMSWALESGFSGERAVCVESAQGTLGAPTSTSADDDAIFLTVANPPLDGACGLDIVLVIDVSGSINSTQLAQAKAAFVDFVNALLPATPTEFAIVEFDTDASVLHGFSSNAASLISAINSAGGGGFTNWDDALFDARSLFPNRLDKPDLILFSSDGNPNRIGGHAPHGPVTSVSSGTAVSYAVMEADAAKTAGIRIIALGIGTAVNVANLEAISSPDAVLTSGFDTLADDLAELALELCGGTITVTKLIDADGSLATSGDRTPGQGWTFSTNVDAPDFSTPASGMTDVNGQINFDIDHGDDLAAVVDVIETLQPGNSLLSASCTLGGNPIGTPGGLAVNDIPISPLDVITCTFINAYLCGDGVLSPGEDCDDGNNDDGDCCSATCTYETAGSPCGNQSPEGACDLSDVCDSTGTCVSNRVPSGTECRPAAGDCDVPESCDGVGADCPVDGFALPALECRPAAGDCDVPEFCSGSGAQCPPDAVAPGTTECRASAGVCDPAEFCDGVGTDCPADVLEPGSTECRPSAGVCDPAEFCDGSNPGCPADVVEPGSTECRPAAGVCDPAEFCDGVGVDCPSDVLDSGTECRASAGVCDPAEFCDGLGADCPADVLDNASECRPSAGACDPAEFCDGASADCPADVLEPNTTECRPSAGACDPAEFCDGAGVDCPADTLDSGTECRPSTGVCDPAEVCDGTGVDCPADVFDNASECRPSAGVCDPAEFCDGSGADCPVDVLDNATECRASAGVCDPAEFCDGTGVDCPADVLDNGTECRASSGVCDPAEFCDGTGADCPADLLDSGTECRASAGDCDLAEFCDGTGPDCPSDALDSGTECRPAAGECDVAEVCSGMAIDCPPDGFRPANAPCGDDGDECTGDVCNGSGTCTHPDNMLCGSCCLASKACVEDVLQGTCSGQGGSFNGVGSSCQGDDDGDGVDDLCDNCGGVDDVVFGTRICKATGRHCSTDADCENGDFCEKACIGAIPTTSEWGLAVLALLLLVTGKLAFSRREMARS